MTMGSVLWWLGRMAFLAVLLGFILQLYRALAASSPTTDARRRGRSGRLMLEEVAESAEVWLKEGTGEQRRLTPGARISVTDCIQIGRGPENQLRIVDPYVSTRHCVVREVGGQFIVTDLGTTNGTRVDDRPLTGRASLDSGMTIEVGRARFRFEVK